METDTKYLEHGRSIGRVPCTVSCTTSGCQSRVPGETACSAFRKNVFPRLRRNRRRLFRLRTRKDCLRRVLKNLSKNAETKRRRRFEVYVTRDRNYIRKTKQDLSKLGFMSLKRKGWVGFSEECRGRQRIE